MILVIFLCLVVLCALFFRHPFFPKGIERECNFLKNYQMNEKTIKDSKQQNTRLIELFVL